MIPYPLEVRVAEVKNDFPSAIFFDLKDLGGDDLYVICRPLSMIEVENAMLIQSRNEQSAIEWVYQKSFVCGFCIQTKTDIHIDEMPIGAPNQLFTLVMEASQLMDPADFLEELEQFRMLSQSLFYGGMAFIMTAFPQYTPKSVKDLTRTEFAELIMLAELKNQVPFELIDPNANNEDVENNRLLQKIGRQAKENDTLRSPKDKSYLDFGKENEELKKMM